MTGVEHIAAERAVHPTKGYDEAHDDTHTDGSIADLAAALASRENLTLVPTNYVAGWVPEACAHVINKHGHDRIKVLAIAGSLIAAEIDRLERAKTHGQG